MPGKTPLQLALTALLDSVRGSRRVLRHLAAVEHGLTHKDAEGRFLFSTPAEHLQVALRQLDGLLGTTPPPALATLRVNLAGAIKARDRAELQSALHQPRGSFFDNPKPEVTEACAEDFDRAWAEWEATEPAPLRP